MQKLIVFFLIGFTLVYVYFISTLFTQPVAVVVPHHNYVKEKRVEYLNKIQSQRPITKTIVLISPDHYGSNQRDINYADRDWSLSNGTIQFDNNYTEILSHYTNANGKMTQEHGIVNVLPDIKSVWPDAKVVPIMLGQSIELSRLNGFVSDLQNTCKYDCLVITSVDFSHYLPPALADIHDAHTVKILHNMDSLESIREIEIDSPQSIYTLMEYSRKNDANKFKTYYQGNSSRIDNARDAESTSYVMGAYYRSLFYPSKDISTTFLVSHDIDKNRDEPMLGERFFYGTEYVDTNYTGDECFQNHVCVITKSDTYEVEFLDSDEKIVIPHNYVIAGHVSEDGVNIALVPTHIENETRTLTRGTAKTDSLHDTLDPYTNLGTLEVDVTQGEIDEDTGK